MKYFFFLPFVFLVTLSCSTKQVEPNATIPDWYLQPTKYIPANLLYGAGTGDYIEAARKRALQNMSYNFQLRVQASSVNRRSSNRSGDNQLTTTSSLQEEVKLDSKQLTFTNVNDYKIEQIGNQYYVVLTTSYNDLIIENRSKLEKNNAFLEDALQSLSGKSPLQKTAIFSQAKKRHLLSLDALENLEILQIAYKENNISPSYLRENQTFLQNYQRVEKQEKDQIIIGIFGEEKWNTAKNLLATDLQAQGYKIGDDYNVLLEVTGNEEQNLLFDGKIKQSKISLLIELKEPQGEETLYSKEFSLKATSLQSAQEASRKAQTSLSKQITNNLFETLGL